MIPDHVREGVRETLAEIGVPQTAIAEGGAELALDSLKRIELAIRLENRFRIVLEPEDEEGLETLEDLCRVVARRVAEGAERGG